MDETRETRTIYGLRHRPTGGLVRVMQHVTVLGDDPSRDVEIHFSLSLDPGAPCFDAGSPVGLARALLPTSGADESNPLPDGLDPDELEPVVVEETLTRVVRPSPARLERAVLLDADRAIDVGRGMARDFEGVTEILDALVRHWEDLGRVAVDGADPDPSVRAGPLKVVGMCSSEHPSALPDDLAGRIVIGKGTCAAARRALGAVPMPNRGLHLLRRSRRDPGPVYRSVVICLSDARPLPETLVDDLKPTASPAPR